jgi:dolichol-phosphate mannosyltransferase
MSMSRLRSQEAPRLVDTLVAAAGATATVPPAAQASVTALPALSVVVPVHDEQDNIGPLIDEVTAALDGISGGYEIVVVDDGSTDGTAAALRRAARRGLVVVRHRQNCGQSAALFSGVRIARADWIATLDGDGQNDPADIPRLWRLLGETGDPDLKMIAGNRTRRRDTWLKRTSSRIANGVRARLLGDRTPDTGCGLKLFERDAFLRVPHFDHFHRFLPALLQQAGGNVTSVEVAHRPRRSGRSHYGVNNRLWVGIVDLIGVLWLKRRAGRWRPSVVEISESNGRAPRDAKGDE